MQLFARTNVTVLLSPSYYPSEIYFGIYVIFYFSSLANDFLYVHKAKHKKNALILLSNTDCRIFLTEQF